MLTVKQNNLAEYRIKGSKFISVINPCDTTEEADERLSKIRDTHPTATHHCYAFRVNPSFISEHSQDDGEPSGTAGLPILNAMRSANIVGAIVVIVRYYGGTKLGKSGLIDAYRQAAELVINQSALKPIVATRRFEITYPYNQQAIIDKLNHSFTLFEIDATYSKHVQLVIECPEKELPAFEAWLDGIRHLLLKVKKGDLSSHVLI